MIYFTADFHLGHRNIIKFQNRPFSNIHEMNNAIITNYNTIVHNNDTVYILGDIAHHINIDTANELISKLNGKKYLITGNHDKRYDPSLFIQISDYMEISLGGNCFVLMHYPMLSWKKMNKGSYQLHGHIHSQMEYNINNKESGIRRYDVGVDANNFYPVSAKQIVDFFN